MPVSWFIVLLIAIAFAYVEAFAHRQRLKPWIGGFGFFIMAMSMSSGAFSVVNFCLGRWSTHPMVAGGAAFHAAVGGIVAVVLGLIAGGFTFVCGDRMRATKVVRDLLVLFLIQTCSLVLCAGVPELNWW